MTLDSAPWAVDGARTRAATARRALFAKTNGEQGVLLPLDLYVRALPVPGPAVTLDPGGATMPNRYIPNTFGGEAYLVTNPESTRVEVPPTGSAGGATSFVIIRIDDPEFPGTPVPADPLAAVYNRPILVPSITNLSYPFVELARIVQPANTSAITQAMITDLRRVANPMEKTVIIPTPRMAAITTLTTTLGQGQRFPNVEPPYIPIPTWATRMQIRGEWNAVEYRPNAGWGENWIEVGPEAILPHNQKTAANVITGEFAWDAAENSAPYRTNWVAHDEIAVPARFRGTSQPFVLHARRRTAGGAVNLDTHSSTVLEVRFLQVATAA